MPMSKSSTITLGAQTSGEDFRTMDHIKVLRSLLTIHCAGPYSEDVIEFALIFRIGGELQEFNFEGCERLRRNRKAKYITVDLGFPSYRWKGKSDAQIRDYIISAVEEGLVCCVRRLEKDHSPVASDALLSDFDKAKALFLATE